MKAVIIGNHAAGLSAAETLRKGDKACDITVISKEDVPPYSRSLIGYLVSGEKQLDDILFKDADFYETNSIHTMFGVEVLKVLPGEKSVLLSSGDKVNYDVLVIATGGTPAMLNIPGSRNKGVFGFRNLKDAERIIAYCDGVETVAVLGGGLVGLKAAVALRERGRKVKVVVASPNVLSQIAGPPEAERFQEYLMEMGIEIIPKTVPARILGKDKVEGIETTEGKKIQCEMVVVAKGVRANKALVEGTEIETEYGISIDEHCRTSVPDVYAAGDVAQSRDDIRKERWMNALWPFAVEEGRVAVENILGADSVLRERSSMNSLRIDELALITCGLTGARERAEDAEEITVKGPGKWDSKRFILRDNRLIGFALVGDVAHAGVLVSLATRGIDVGEVKDQLLSGKYDFLSMLPLIRENRVKFNKPEYEEVFSFF